LDFLARREPCSYEWSAVDRPRLARQFVRRAAAIAHVG
jgi:hypothetical protein